MAFLLCEKLKKSKIVINNVWELFLLWMKNCGKFELKQNLNAFKLILQLNMSPFWESFVGTFLWLYPLLRISHFMIDLSFDREMINII